MAKLGESFRNIFKIQELRTRLLFTAALLIVVRIGAHVTLPGVDASLLAKAEASQTANTLFGLYDLFVGGAFKNAAIFALGIMPYISASIILQLLGAVVPYFQKLQKEGEEGRKKITQLTRYGTVIVAALQAWGVSVRLTSLNIEGIPIVPLEVQGFGFTLSTVVILTAGTMFMMWLGEQITERGIGNGISLIIFIGIIARFPHSIVDQFRVSQNLHHRPDHPGRDDRDHRRRRAGHAGHAPDSGAVCEAGRGPQGVRRRHAVHPAARQHRGRHADHLRAVDHVHPEHDPDVLPGERVHAEPLGVSASTRRSPTRSCTALMIVFFTYFYTAIAFNPKDVSENMQKQGGFIPGIRPGKHTADFIDNILTKITLPGSIFLAIIAILPAFMSRFGVTPSFAQFFGGTSLLIMVGVALDTLQQVESHLLMRHYDGFMKSGSMKGRLR